MNKGHLIITLGFTIGEEGNEESGKEQARLFALKLMEWAGSQSEVRYCTRHASETADRTELGNPLMHVSTTIINTQDIVDTWNRYQRFNISKLVGATDNPQDAARARSVYVVNSSNSTCAPAVGFNANTRDAIRSAYRVGSYYAESEGYKQWMQHLVNTFDGMLEDGVLEREYYEGAPGQEPTSPATL